MKDIKITDNFGEDASVRIEVTPDPMQEGGSENSFMIRVRTQTGESKMFLTKDEVREMCQWLTKSVDLEDEYINFNKQMYECK